jgi:hypothetical protein
MNWIATLSKEIHVDPMGTKLEALRQAKKLGFDFVGMTDEQKAIVAQRVRETIAAIRTTAKRRAK